VIERLCRWLTPALTSVPGTKRSRTAPLIDWRNAGHAVWTPRDDAALARKGYQTNAIVHRCVRLVAESAAQVGVSVRIGGREVPEHPLNALLTGPNSRQAAGAFLETFYGHLLVAGNACVEAVTLNGAVRELHALGPDRMRVVPGRDGWAEVYDYTVGGESVHFRQDGWGFHQFCTCLCSIRSTTITACRRWRRRRGRSTSTMRREPGTGRCSTMQPAPPARWSMPGRKARR
jgi:phage portal protein BeeE